jgi:hypothetical protein
MGHRGHARNSRSTVSGRLLLAKSVQQPDVSSAYWGCSYQQPRGIIQATGLRRDRGIVGEAGEGDEERDRDSQTQVVVRDLGPTGKRRAFVSALSAKTIWAIGGIWGWVQAVQS